MPDLVPDLAVLKKPLWQVFSIRDFIYGLILVYMLLNQHFNSEQRMEKLENAVIQLADYQAKMGIKLDTEMVPRKEHDAATASLSIRLGNIETAQNNMMTYLLNHGR